MYIPLRHWFSADPRSALPVVTTSYRRSIEILNASPIRIMFMYPNDLCINNSTSAYKCRRNDSMWITGIYKHIRSYLPQSDRVKLWSAHKRFLRDVKPKVLINRELNPAYALWHSRQIPIFVSNKKNYLYLKGTI